MLPARLAGGPTDPGKGWLMQLCIRRRDWAAAMDHYWRLEETLRPERAPTEPEDLLLYEMTTRGG